MNTLGAIFFFSSGNDIEKYCLYNSEKSIWTQKHIMSIRALQFDLLSTVWNRTVTGLNSFFKRQNYLHLKEIRTLIKFYIVEVSHICYCFGWKQLQDCSLDIYSLIQGRRVTDVMDLEKESVLTQIVVHYPNVLYSLSPYKRNNMTCFFIPTLE